MGGVCCKAKEPHPKLATKLDNQAAKEAEVAPAPEPRKKDAPVANGDLEDEKKQQAPVGNANGTNGTVVPAAVQKNFRDVVSDDEFEDVVPHKKGSGSGGRSGSRDRNGSGGRSGSRDRSGSGGRSAAPAGRSSSHDFSRYEFIASWCLGVVVYESRYWGGEGLERRGGVVVGRGVSGRGREGGGVVPRKKDRIGSGGRSGSRDRGGGGVGPAGNGGIFWDCF